MFCSNCGKELVPNAKFCAGCGAQVLVTALPMAEYQKLMAAASAPQQPQYPQQPAQRMQQPQAQQYPQQRMQQAPQQGQGAVDERGYIRTRQCPVGITYGMDNERCDYRSTYAYVKFSARNLVRRPIKYLLLYFQAYNRVDDPVDDVLKFQFTGPLEYKQKIIDITPAHTWSYRQTSYFKILKLDVDFMDGTKVTVDGNDIPPFKSPLLE